MQDYKNINVAIFDKLLWLSFVEWHDCQITDIIIGGYLVDNIPTNKKCKARSVQKL